MWIIEDVVGRLYNCKFRSAYDFIKNNRKIPKEIKREFKFAADELGNCGWGGALIDRRATTLALLIGYKWSDKKEYYVKI